MSAFSKYVAKKLCKSVLTFGDSEIVLEFEPFTVEEAKNLGKIKDLTGEESSNEMARLFALKCKTLLDGKILTQEDFLGIDVDSLIKISEDVTQSKKAQG